MGYSVSQETWERTETNRRLGRLCQGSSRCSVRATKVTHQRSWAYKVNEGPMLPEKPMVMCAKHAAMCPPGYHGVNFIVDRVEDLPRLTSAEIREAEKVWKA